MSSALGKETAVPICPKCRRPMAAGHRLATNQIAGHGQLADLPRTAPISVPVWHCAECGIDRGRFD